MKDLMEMVLANTPHSAKDVIIYGEWLQRLLQTQAFVIPQGMWKPLARFVKGSPANACSRQTSERDLEAIHKEAVVKRARKAFGKSLQYLPSRSGLMCEVNSDRGEKKSI